MYLTRSKKNLARLAQLYEEAGMSFIPEDERRFIENPEELEKIIRHLQELNEVKVEYGLRPTHLAFRGISKADQRIIQSLTEPGRLFREQIEQFMSLQKDMHEKAKLQSDIHKKSNKNTRKKTKNNRKKSTRGKTTSKRTRSRKR